MIQIDMKMPKSCDECPFIKCGCGGFYCILDPDPCSKYVEEYTKTRSPSCPLIEVKKEEPNSTARVGLFSHPEWCPLVETQIAEVGQKFVEAKERVMKEYRKQKEEPKHENLNIPKCCGECDSMKSMRGPFGDPFFYCGSPTHLAKDPMQDISTARVGLFSRPEWCPLVETQKALDAMPPEKREKADMMMRGLKAMFGVEGDE